MQQIAPKHSVDFMSSNAKTDSARSPAHQARLIAQPRRKPLIASGNFPQKGRRHSQPPRMTAMSLAATSKPNRAPRYPRPGIGNPNPQSLGRLPTRPSRTLVIPKYFRVLRHNRFVYSLSLLASFTSSGYSDGPHSERHLHLQAQACTEGSHKLHSLQSPRPTLHRFPQPQPLRPNSSSARRAWSALARHLSADRSSQPR